MLVGVHGVVLVHDMVPHILGEGLEGRISFLLEHAQPRIQVVMVKVVAGPSFAIQPTDERYTILLSVQP